MTPDLTDYPRLLTYVSFDKAAKYVADLLEYETIETLRITPNARYPRFDIGVPVSVGCTLHMAV